MRNVGLLTLAAGLTDGRCRAAEDGAACVSVAKFRGLCPRHYWAAKARRLVDRIGLPPVQLKHDIRLKAADQLQPGICRVVVNGEPCPLPAQRRGLCDRHYAAIWQRPDLRLDDFAVAPITSDDFRARKIPLPGRCRVVERDVPCDEPPHARGLCQRHYAWLREKDLETFERLAEPDRSRIIYALRIRLRPDRCRVAENGQPCGEKNYCRGLCVHHYAVLFDKREVFEQIALPARKIVARVFGRKPVPEPGTCHIVENGVGCTAPVEHRGLCMGHYRILRSRKGYRLADFLLPVPQPVYTLKPVEQRNSAICRVLADGEPCQDAAFARGLCRRHHRALQRLGRVAEFGAVPHKSGEVRCRTAHAYLDKNILFDWCDARAFAGSGQQASCDLVERVRAGRMVATISASAVTSAYNHVRHRAYRPVSEGGQALTQDAAETLARGTVKRLLEGTWRILSLSPHNLRTVLDAAPALQSYEDALEWAAYQAARGGHHGPRWFVTRDGDFPEGIPPWTLEEHLVKSAQT
jgi:hypothetical protein